ERPPLFAVADGMGGARAGEVASRTAIEVLAAGGHPGSPRPALVEAAQAANRKIQALALDDPSRAGMGTTLTAALLAADKLTVVHVGDSRLYRLRNGVLERLTRDHSLVAELMRRGELTADEARNHPARSMLLRALGPESRVAVDSCTLSVQDGDLYLLCSDGLTTMIAEAEIARILLESDSLELAARRLIDAANERGGRDNVTVVLFRLGECEEPAPTVPEGLATISSPTP
ncbi:MAG TPA: Stp1/IreP family PP2C-type Ser/Thr phosphatase, partial [Solirubrobacteraceae bacterium]|nr:Stp1/IreP family PP2C-type Ser/Thr phosphatase [Solirubrobacteraceae bacterium]